MSHLHKSRLAQVVVAAIGGEVCDKLPGETAQAICHAMVSTVAPPEAKPAKSPRVASRIPTSVKKKKR